MENKKENLKKKRKKRKKKQNKGKRRNKNKNSNKKVKQNGNKKCQRHRSLIWKYLSAGLFQIKFFRFLKSDIFKCFCQEKKLRSVRTNTNDLRMRIVSEPREGPPSATTRWR